MEGVDHVFHFAANPDIAKAMAEPVGRLLGGHLPHQQRARGHAPGRGAAAHLRLGQRRLRRRRRAAGARGPAAAADLALRRLQARLRGDDQRLLPHVRHARADAALRQRGRARTRPTAWPTTSSAACARTRPSSRSWATARQSKSYVHVDDVVDALVGLFPEEGRPVRVPERGHRGLPDRAARSPTWWPSGSGSRASSTASARAPAAGRATCRSCASTARARGRCGWSNARTSREAMAASIDAMIARSRPRRRARG